MKKEFEEGFDFLNVDLSPTHTQADQPARPNFSPSKTSDDVWSSVSSLRLNPVRNEVGTMSKSVLHRLIEELPEERENEARIVLEQILDRREYTPDTAPLNDEPLSDEDRAALADAREEHARGEGIPHAEVRRILNL